jgi:hypothetical protein
MTATYTPDANSTGLLTSTSTTVVTETIAQILNCGTQPSAQTGAQGSTANYSFSICRASTLGTPTASVTICPTDAQCGNTVTLTNAAGVYTVGVTITPGTASRSVPLQNRPPQVGSRPLALLWFGAFLAMLMAIQLARQNRARPRLLYASGFLMALLLSGISGCASSGGPSNINNTGTPPNTYTVNVTVTAGSFSVKVPLTLTVTQ